MTDSIPTSPLYKPASRLELIRSSETNTNRIPLAATDRVNYEETLEEKMKNIRSSFLPYAVRILSSGRVRWGGVFLGRLYPPRTPPRDWRGFVPLCCDTHCAMPGRPSPCTSSPRGILSPQGDIVPREAPPWGAQGVILHAEGPRRGQGILGGEN